MRSISMAVAALIPPLLSLVATIIFFKSNSVLAEFNLQNYIINAPSCSISEDLNVHCNFSNIEPINGSIASFITGFDTCQGSATRDSELSLTATNGVVANGTFNVVIDINTNLNLTNGESETFTFCLLTHLRDASDNLMIWQGQKINSTFIFRTDFSVVSSLHTQVFEAGNVVEEVDSGSKISFTTACRCRSLGLAIGVMILIDYIF
ncbi:unnamed protein product [Cylindrotheca closterium]|uniref:Uncharacterized protein n=1 Tax=Cylindrotheca closterium TaxID=2856 RepID=A0AAD2JM28_9STRA|nr:unnamed protein product [Cylindrotheca closterium]